MKRGQPMPTCDNGGCLNTPPLGETICRRCADEQESADRIEVARRRFADAVENVPCPRTKDALEALDELLDLLP